MMDGDVAKPYGSVLRCPSPRQRDGQDHTAQSRLCSPDHREERSSEECLCGRILACHNLEPWGRPSDRPRGTGSGRSSEDTCHLGTHPAWSAVGQSCNRLDGYCGCPNDGRCVGPSHRTADRYHTVHRDDHRDDRDDRDVGHDVGHDDGPGDGRDDRCGGGNDDWCGGHFPGVDGGCGARRRGHQCSRRDRCEKTPH